jgi:ribonucleotide reductase beta subunit family protein with ferritin-like domain
MSDQKDPIFEAETRNTILPIKYPTIWNNYKKQAGCYWQVHEVPLNKDKEQWNTLHKDEQHFIKMVLAFFASGDLLVNKNLVERFLQEITIHEIQIAYGYQRMMENIHSEMYALLIDTYITDHAEKKYIFNAIENISVIKKIANWVNSLIESDKPYCERLLGFAAFEGILFSGPFCAIFWLREKGKLPGLTLSNDFISRDEGLHVENASIIHSLLKNKVSKQRCTEIIQEAVMLSVEFITVSLPCNLIGMNSSLMIEYIKFTSNRLSKQFGHEDIYMANQPFTFMDRICLVNKSNFFENKVSEYSKLAVEEEGDAYDDL